MNPFERKFRAFAHSLTAKECSRATPHTLPPPQPTLFRRQTFYPRITKGFTKLPNGGSPSHRSLPIATTAALGVYAFQHISSLTSWGMFTLPSRLHCSLRTGLKRLKAIYPGNIEQAHFEVQNLWACRLYGSPRNVYFHCRRLAWF
jgi:hypothetical protein